ncbi:2-amino-4-hydroxy-6-hydroxymethyldihydropteridine diphosphokinase [Desulforhabdus sp. TSK]|uniref:2-amino-4-hydroxy-6- hydroxymethyldihydropteridine diphosphokinase n=1 Tax=Desulforhabdus sp. TSK TaxID=2925014 RepID=UPI002111E0A6|nr:2-amino-4-hydroxy-6-hydroxymethyldihydropteridine diphosphokinase [Desulforhabdus sp. TSK]
MGFGSNQGESVRICMEAIECFRNHPHISVLKVSALYRTNPVGLIDQGWFVNGAFLCETRLSPLELLDFCLQVESRFGRVRQVRWGPRTLDLDILFFGQQVIDLPQLQVPHPRLHERRFVLVPLSEIAPFWKHPQRQMSITQMLSDLSPREEDQEVIRMDTQ